MTATDSHLLLRAFCDELARCGVRHACTSPGSRCTPIVASLARQPGLRCWSHIDERCSGFFALGAAKASATPVVVTCTSGTAAANLAPAVSEAFEARVPLIVLTADRPPELRDLGAGQTIDQLKLYGDAVKWFCELGVDRATPAALRWVRSLACRAFCTARDGRPGPVHINVPLREPLTLDVALPAEPGEGGRTDGRPWVSTEVPAGPRRRGRGRSFERAVIVAGAMASDPGAGDRLAALAARARVPLLADPLSGARRGPAAIAHYDLLLRDPASLGELTPSAVYRVGDLPTSKPLRLWLGSLDVPQLSVSEQGSWQDPDARVSDRISAPIGAALELLEGDDLIPDRGDWLDRWRALDAALQAAAARALGDGLSEPAIAAGLGEWLPPEVTLFVASSMPVRDVEEFFPVREDPPRVLSNRGANGIDGTVSSAFGAAVSSNGRLVLLIGDVALAHDIGGLLAAKRLGLAITIALVNNDGGGIFHFLPVASQADIFEQHVATPHGLDFARAAALYGCEHERPTTREGFRAAIERSLESDKTTIVEVRTGRAQNQALHRRVSDAALSAALSAARP